MLPSAVRTVRMAFSCRPCSFSFLISRNCSTTLLRIIPVPQLITPNRKLQLLLPVTKHMTFHSYQLRGFRNQIRSSFFSCSVFIFTSMPKRFTLRPRGEITQVIFPLRSQQFCASAQNCRLKNKPSGLFFNLHSFPSKSLCSPACRHASLHRRLILHLPHMKADCSVPSVLPQSSFARYARRMSAYLCKQTCPSMRPPSGRIRAKKRTRRSLA